MYYITLEGGLFHCECMVQDGWERWTEKSLKEAVKSMKTAAEVLNHQKIKKERIVIRKAIVENIPTTKYIPYSE